MAETRYQCTFCGTRFVSEDRFMKHRCKEMIRDEEFRSADGQTAWMYYQKWMKAYRRLVPNSKSFLHSKFFGSFYKFAQFVKKVQIPDTDAFIKLMKDKDISPTLWTNDQVYALYLEYVDRIVPPLKHAEITINTLFDVAEEHGIDVADVFTVIKPNDLIQLLRQRKVSPWILLNSPKFRDFFVRKTTSEEKVILESIIRPSYWKKKFSTNPTSLTVMKTYVSELHL